MPESLTSDSNVRFCVMGAGNGGMVMAAHLTIKGFPVTLYNRTEDYLAPVREHGIIRLASPGLDDVESGEAKIDRITTDAEAALADADIVMIVVPAYAHASMADACAPHLHDDHIVVLNPGATGGALEFRHTIRQRGCNADPFIAETDTLLYTCRVMASGEARIFALKKNVTLAALPAYRTSDVLAALRPAYPQLVAAENVLETSLGDVNVLFHPAVMAMNAGRVEDTGGQFRYYVQGMTPSVAKVLESMDREKLALAAKLGITIPTARDWMRRAYGVVGPDLYCAVQSNAAYAAIMAPHTLEHRYILEDVPMNLIPLISIARQLGVPTPIMSSIAHICCALLSEDFWSTGRTVESLGIAGLTATQIRTLVMEGERPEA